MNLRKRKNLQFAVTLAIATFSSLPALALDPARKGAGGEPGWERGVVLFGQEREQVKSMPITERPYRPLHFYGNTVRRMHYRGTAIPAPRDVVRAGAATIVGD
jgi:hypothetical protein